MKEAQKILRRWRGVAWVAWAMSLPGALLLPNPLREVAAAVLYSACGVLIGLAFCDALVRQAYNQEA